MGDKKRKSAIIIRMYMYMYMYVTGSGKIRHFADSMKIKILLNLASILFELQVCAVSELQCFVTQPFILPKLRVIKLCVHTHKRKSIKMADFRRSSHYNYYNMLNSQVCKILVVTIKHFIHRIISSYLQ